MSYDSQDDLTDPLPMVHGVKVVLHELRLFRVLRHGGSGRPFGVSQMLTYQHDSH